VIVIDDGSNDETRAALSRYFDVPNFLYVQLRKNIGTACAKNVALALAPFAAVTFHDSDDIPDSTKLLRQTRILNLPAVVADSCLNWAPFRIAPNASLPVAVALTEHIFITADGSRNHMRRALSLVDDFFPHLQMAAGPPGDWILINSGLFRRSIFTTHGGFDDCIEEDREFRNRLIMAGEVIWLIAEPLLTKIDQADSLTADARTGYASEKRRQDRNEVWARIAAWRATGSVPHQPLDLANIDISFVSRQGALKIAQDMPMTDDTRRNLERLILVKCSSEKS
jgi:glycosyltransferase involved in cell wall biosynthesis